MIRGSKIFRPADVPESNASGYPPEFRESQRKRFNRRLGDHGGLRNFGVNQVRVAPGGQSSARHAHSAQDEFVYILQGRPTLLTDEGRTLLAPGMCAGFRAASGDAHCLINETSETVFFLEVGDRTPGDHAEYPDDDLRAEMIDGTWQFSHKDGSPY